ncbi:MAG: adenylosuccinate lyase family protein [Pseudomonadota bacterium]
MPAIVIGSRIFRDMFAPDQMRALFSDEWVVSRYLDVEGALARVQAADGLIPAEAGHAISATAADMQIDWDRLGARTRIVGFPILPLVEQLSEAVPNGLGQWCHWGATTQDIMDTADVLQIRAALDLIAADLDGVASALAKLAEAHADLPMAGRTHMQHALPITFCYKAATWLSGIDRHRARLVELRPRVEVVSFSGAAGTLASLGEEGGLATQTGLAAELDLAVPPITWHSIRDGMAEVTGFLAMVAASLGKIGFDIALMMQSETGEVLEPFVPGRGASSTMPQKRNPIACEMLIAQAKLVREQHSAMLDAMVQDHERPTGQWQVEWQALPTAFLLTGASLKAAREVLEGLEVRADRMREVLDVTGGLIVAEAVMMQLAPRIGRQVAHDVVYDCCRKTLSGDGAFIDNLVADPAIGGVIPRAELERFVDPANYLGAAPAMVRRLLAARKG